MKTPITYYGGKQSMIKDILPLIDYSKNQYVEPFFGGGAIFFAKEPHKHEVINDLDNRVVNFYEVLKNDFEALKKKIDTTLHSEYLHKTAREILKDKNADKIEMAWAFWVQTNMSYNKTIGSGFTYSHTKNNSTQTKNKRESFKICLSERLENIEIFCRDALNIITLKNIGDTFFYIDPPYYNADMGHYEGYTEQDFINLLNKCEEIKGHFLLSSYDSKILQDYITRNKWQQKIIEMNCSAVNAKKIKYESLVYNYTLEKELF